MYELDSTRQKFDVWIGVEFLLDRATKPVEWLAEMWQPIQTSNFCRIWFVELNSTRQKCDVWTGPYGIRIKSYAWIFTIQVALSSILFIHFHVVCLIFEARPILYFFFNIAGVLLSIIVFKSAVAQASQAQWSTLHTWCIENCSEVTDRTKLCNYLIWNYIFTSNVSRTCLLCRFWRHSDAT